MNFLLKKTWLSLITFYIFSSQKGEIQKSSTMDAVVTLRKDLKDMSKNLRLFSLSMRSLYTENFVRMKAETGQKFKKLRDDTRNDAMVYLKGILPLSRTFATSMSDYFKYYETLDFQKWCELLSSIREKTVGNKKLCEMILKLHEDILVPLKKRQDQAELVVTECEGLQEKFEEKKKEYEDKAQTKTNWAFGLSFVPGVGMIASHVLKENAKADLAEAHAHGDEAEVQEAAAIAIRETLIPALESFIEGITRTAGFFSIVEQEISKFEGKAGKAIDTRKRLHYKVMKREAQDMNSVCQAFSAALLDVNADFDVISSEGTDQNYVDRCLEKHSRTIKATCTTSNFVSSLLAATTGGIAGVIQGETLTNLNFVGNLLEATATGPLRAVTGAVAGSVPGAVTGAVTGSATGPLSAFTGAVSGSVTGAVTGAANVASELLPIARPMEVSNLLEATGAVTGAVAGSATDAVTGAANVASQLLPPSLTKLFF